MSYLTVEVDITEGRIVPRGGEPLPARARGLLILLDPIPKGNTCGELADWWAARDRLPAEEAEAFAQEIENARKTLPPVKDTWG